MRALRLHGPADLRLEEVADPVPGAGELTVRVDRALTCATDAKMFRNGRHPALPPLPAPFGHELAGTIDGVGVEVEGLHVGQRVVVANSAPCGVCRRCRRGRPNLCQDIRYLVGAFAERLLVPARIVDVNVLLLPDEVSSERAALAEPIACALHGAGRLDVREGDLAVILGAGIQGCLLATALARRGCRVWISDPHVERRARAERFGAERTWPAMIEPKAIEDLREATPDGAGADVVVEAVGRPEAWRAAVRLAAPGAEVLLHGGCAAGSEVTFPTDELHYSELTLRGSYHHTPSTVREALALIADGGLPLETLLGEEISLADVPAVLAEGGEKRPVAIGEAERAGVTYSS